MQITATDLSAAYGAQIVFQGLSFVIPAGSVTALVGPSGSGKTSLLALLAGYETPRTGKVVFQKEGQSRAPSPDLISWVSQGSAALFRRSARDNVAIAPLSERLSLARSHALADEMLDRVGLSGKELRQARALSGGELQRLAFARALASSRPVIFADEPTASLDRANTVAVTETLSRLRDLKTVIVASHDPVVIERVDHVVALR